MWRAKTCERFQVFKRLDVVNLDRGVIFSGPEQTAVVAVNRGVIEVARVTGKRKFLHETDGLRMPHRGRGADRCENESSGNATSTLHGSPF